MQIDSVAATKLRQTPKLRAANCAKVHQTQTIEYVGVYRLNIADLHVVSSAKSRATNSTCTTSRYLPEHSRINKAAPCSSRRFTESKRVSEQSNVPKPRRWQSCPTGPRRRGTTRSRNSQCPAQYSCRRTRYNPHAKSERPSEAGIGLGY